MIKHFHFITLFPEMIENFFSEGVVSKACKKELLSMSILNPRTFTEDVHQTVDDKPFGGGDGMLLKPEPLFKSLDSIKGKCKKTKVIYLSPQGSLLNHNKVKSLAQDEHELIFLCGRYAGIDQRVINEHVDEEISIGDYVISGGELAACVLTDAIARQIPGVLGNELSASEDSFKEGLLEAPQFTRPQNYNELEVPEILLSGDHKKIKEFEHSLKIINTYTKRPDLFKLSNYTEEDYKAALKEISKLGKEVTKSLGLNLK